MSQAKETDRVKVHYTGSLEDGTVFDSSKDRSPLEFTIGEGKIIKGLEEAVVGMSPGESKTAKIPAEAAYGPRREEMVVAFSRDRLPADIEPEVGQQLQLQKQTGETIPVIVSSVSEAEVVLDANHPLAGKDLMFDIQLVEVQ